MDELEKQIPEITEEELIKGKCVRCSNSVSTKGGRCSACLKKLKTARQTPGTYQRNHQQADSALRRQDGKNGTASHKSSGRGSRDEIVGKMKRAEKKTGQKLSADRTDNAKGYASKNVRAIPQKLNRGRHNADPKKLAAWRKRLKKNDEQMAALYERLRKADIDVDDFLTLLKAKMHIKSDELLKILSPE